LSVESEPVAQVVDIVAEPAGLDPTGALKSGHLVLYSLVTMARLKRSRIDFFGAEMVDLDLYVYNLKDSEHKVLILYIDYDKDRRSLNGQDLLYVLICRTMTLPPDNPYLRTFGLLLASAGEFLYRRVGRYELPSRDEIQEAYKLREVTIM
jgi:hypothetical protein